MARPSGLDWSSSFEHRVQIWGWQKEKQGDRGARRVSCEPGPRHPFQGLLIPRPGHEPRNVRSPQRELVCGVASKPQEDPKQRVEHSKGMWGHEGRQHSKLLHSRKVNQVRLTCLIRLLKRALLAEELVLAGRSVGRVTPRHRPLEQSAATYRNKKQGHAGRGSTAQGVLALHHVLHLHHWEPDSRAMAFPSPPRALSTLPAMRSTPCEQERLNPSVT